MRNLKFAKWPTAATLEGWIFGHYDSRGGAVLVTGAAHVVEAMETYLRGMGWLEGDQKPDANGWDSAHEDLIGKRTLIFLGTEQPERGGELLASYRDEGGWEAHKLEMNYPSDRKAQWFEDENVAVMVPMTAAQQEAWAERDDDGEGRPFRVQVTEDAGFKMNGTKYRLRPWDLGEDACGLYWLPEAGEAAAGADEAADEREEEES